MLGKLSFAQATNTAPVAQRIEHLTTDQKVGGSNPSGRTSQNPRIWKDYYAFSFHEREHGYQLVKPNPFAFCLAAHLWAAPAEPR